MIMITINIVSTIPIIFFSYRCSSPGSPRVCNAFHSIRWCTGTCLQQHLSLPLIFVDFRLILTFSIVIIGCLWTSILNGIFRPLTVWADPMGGATWVARLYSAVLTWKEKNIFNWYIWKIRICFLFYSVSQKRDFLKLFVVDEHPG